MVQMEVSPQLKEDAAHSAIVATHIGQAHIAGTGPAGATCETCVFWHLWKKVKIDDEVRDVRAKTGRFSKRHKERPGERKDALCNKPILNKARRKIPASAVSCRFYEPKQGAKNAEQ
jgi:hypothetical protein